jgi:hypothetical protein
MREPNAVKAPISVTFAEDHRMLGLSIPLKYPNRGFGMGSRATVTGYRRFGTQRGSNVDMPLTGDELRTTNLCGGGILSYDRHGERAASRADGSRGRVEGDCDNRTSGGLDLSAWCVVRVQVRLGLKHSASFRNPCFLRGYCLRRLDLGNGLFGRWVLAYTLLGYTARSFRSSSFRFQLHVRLLGA